jgi:hypothetical protein
MPEIIDLRGRSVYFGRLAKDRHNAGDEAICAKLTEVAADLEAQAIALERQRSSRLN